MVMRRASMRWRRGAARGGWRKRDGGRWRRGLGGGSGGSVSLLESLSESMSMSMSMSLSLSLSLQLPLCSSTTPLHDRQIEIGPAFDDDLRRDRLVVQGVAAA